MMDVVSYLFQLLAFLLKRSFSAARKTVTMRGDGMIRLLLSYQVKKASSPKVCDNLTSDDS